MFPAMYTHYYWEEKREEIYRSAPTRTPLVAKGRKAGGRRVRSGRRLNQEENTPALECLCHGGTKWAGHYDQLMDGLCGHVLPNRPGFKEQLAHTVCSCNDRHKDKCKEAAARFGFTSGSNLPAVELNDRMRFTELYFHNILNSPQFSEDYINNANVDDPMIPIVEGLYAARSVLYALVQRCVLSNDLKAYCLLDIIRLYIQKPNSGKVHLPLPSEEGPALEMLFMLEKGDHMNVVAKLFGCQIVLGLSGDSECPALELNLSTANLADIKAVEEYFEEPIGYKQPVEEQSPQPEAEQKANEAIENSNNRESEESIEVKAGESGEQQVPQQVAPPEEADTGGGGASDPTPQSSQDPAADTAAPPVNPISNIGLNIFGDSSDEEEEEVESPQGLTEQPQVTNTTQPAIEPIVEPAGEQSTHEKSTTVSSDLKEPSTQIAQRSPFSGGTDIDRPSIEENVTDNVVTQQLQESAIVTQQKESASADPATPSTEHTTNKQQEAVQPPTNSPANSAMQDSPEQPILGSSSL